MENNDLYILLSVFDFKKGPVPILCLPQDLGTEINSIISFEGHLLLTKLSGQDFNSFGLLVPFSQFKLVGYLFIFKVDCDPTYSNENTYLLISFLVSVDYLRSFFSLINDFQIIVSNISQGISLNFQYKGDGTDFTEIRENLEKNRLNLRKNFESRINELNKDIYLIDGIDKKFYYFLNNTKKNLDLLLYGLLVDLKQSILIYSQNENFLHSVIECLKILSPHRLLIVEFAGKEKEKRNSDIMVCTNSVFFNNIKDKFDIVVDYEEKKITSKNNIKNKFIKEIADFLIEKLNSPELLSLVIKSKIQNQLLEIAGDIILASGSLTEKEKTEKLDKISKRNAKFL